MQPILVGGWSYVFHILLNWQTGKERMDIMKTIKRMVTLLTLILVMSLPAAIVVANTYWAPDDFVTIQAAIDNPGLVQGDTIVVRDGIYYENIVFGTQAITLCSENGAAYTTIDGGGTGRVVYFNSDSSGALSSTLKGFTITNGGAGGIDMHHASPTITNCVITGNTNYSHGGGIGHYGYCYPKVTNCTISGNHTDESGGGIYAPCVGVITVVNSIVWGNSGDGEIYTGCGASTVNMTYSNIQGGYSGTGNIDADPLFVNADIGDFHLQPTSPCIDVGNTATELPETDFENDPRTVDGDGNGTVTVDMGADEYGTDALRAAFKGFHTSGRVPLGVIFTDASAGQIESWLWDFGDEGTSTDENPVHTYTQAATYTVSLTVSGPGGEDTETKINYIVADPCQPEVMSVAPTSGLNSQTTGINIFGSCFKQGATGSIYGGASVASSIDTYGALAVHVSGNYAYLAANDEGLKVIDVSNPASPSVVGSCSMVCPADVYVSGNHAYVTNNAEGVNGSGFEVIDVSNPASPLVVGSGTTPSYASAVYVSGDYAYVAVRHDGLQVTDVSNPASPSVVGSCSMPDLTRNIHISGNYAYVTNNYLGLVVVDISNPVNPFIVGSCDIPYYANTVYVSGNYAYVSAGYSGLQVVNVSNPANPFIVGSCDTVMASGVHVTGNYAYVTDGYTGLRVVDVTNPTTPILVGSSNTPDYARNVFLSGNHAYVAMGSSGLQVVNKFVPFADVTWVSETEITATVPEGFVPGTYDLHVTNPGGESGTMFNAFTVTGYPPANFIANPTSGERPLTVQFTDQSTGDVTSWSWSFGDGGTSTQQNPSYEYTDAGDYTVSLTVTGPVGSDTETKTDYIHVSEPSGAPVIDKVGNRNCLPGERIRIIGSGFGDTQGNSVVHLNNLTYGPGHARIRSWSDTMIRLKIPYKNKPCEWYTHGDGQYRRRRVWVTVDGVDSNKKAFKIMKPDNCQ